jgi:hypothetical protein
MTDGTLACIWFGKQVVLGVRYLNIYQIRVIALWN